MNLTSTQHNNAQNMGPIIQKNKNNNVQNKQTNNTVKNMCLKSQQQHNA